MKLVTCRLFLAILGLIALGIGLAPAASATSFVMMSDEAMTDLAPTIVRGRIVSSDPTPFLDLPFTDYMIEVDRVLKGSIPGSTLIVRVPGGVRSDGIGFHVFGAPRFGVDDRALLFLSPAGDGTFRIYQLILGAFHERSFEGERLALRNFAETHEMVTSGQEPSERLRARAPRKIEAFAAWIVDRIQGIEREPDYFLEPSESEGLRSQEGAFTLFEDPDDGLNMRWFSFDQGQQEVFRIHQDGQPGLSMQQFRTGVQRGIAAWNNVPGANIRYAFGGTTAATGGLTDPDGVRTVVAEDPNDNDLFGGEYSCFNGGVLAIGGPWFTISTQPGPGGQIFHRIAEGDVITNKNLGCFFDSSPNRQAAASELFGHELGHTLGKGHSCGDNNSPSCFGNPLLDEALMRASIHDDGRGARLNDDDRAAARTLYPGNSAGGPAPPSGLAAQAVTSTQVQLTWNDNSDDEDSFDIQQRIEGGAFVNVNGFFGPDTTSVLLGGLVPGTTYSYRVRARNNSGVSSFAGPVTVALPNAPNAPSELTAVPLSSSEIRLSWQDNGTDTNSFVLEMKSPGSNGFSVAQTVFAAQQTVLESLTTSTPYTFRIRAEKDGNFSEYSTEASATTEDLVPGPCVADATTLCLDDERFRVRVQWRDGNSGNTGPGRAVAIPDSDVSGLFWFFTEDNIELVVKTLDATSFSGFFWNFYGALSNVEYWITVTDTEVGENVTYHNPQNEICGFPDTRAFPRPENPQPAPATSAHQPRVIGGLTARETARRIVLSNDAPTPGSELTSVAGSGTTGGNCVPTDTALCLLDNRFRVEVQWDNSLRSGNPEDRGVGRVRPVTSVDGDETGFFWFFDEENIELVVKILDARVINDHFWVFYGGLSDVEYTIVVTDTQTNTILPFTNEAGDFCGDADTGTL